MNEIEVVRAAKRMVKPLVILNVIFILAVISAITIFGSSKTAIYFGIFFVVEATLFLVFFVPALTYNLIRGRGIKYALSKGMLAFGEFYQHVTPW